MSRFSNLVVLTMLFFCVYINFSVKNDVTILARKIAVLKNDIVQEQQKIEIYKVEWATLTGASHIAKLQKKICNE